MGDDDFGFLKFRMLLVFGIAFAGLCVWSFMDLAFLALGRDGTATVSDVYEFQSRRSRSVIMEFTFREPDGHERKGKTNLGETSSPPLPGMEFEIQYLPRWLLNAPDAARPKRDFNWIVLTLFLLTSAGLGVFTYRAIYPPDDAPRPSSKRRR